MTDEKLMQNVIAGKQASMNQLIIRYQNDLLRFFTRMSGNKHTAEDMVQMTFERVYRYRNGYKDDQSFKTWIWQIARNVWNSSFRKHEKLTSLTVNTDQKVRDASKTFELQQLIQTALMTLSERERELVVFYHLKGFGYKELSQIFETSEGNLRVIQCRALKKLGQVLKQLGYEH